VCFADITLDNPNVWFELGYALAAGKEICIICSEERQGRFPFDIQHRAIVKYRVDSPSDYEELKSNIAVRLQAIMKREVNLAAVSTPSLLKESHGLSQHEIIVLTAIAENQEGLESAVAHWTLRNQMDRLGYNNLAVNVGTRRLLKRDMIGSTVDRDNNGDPSTYYTITQLGYDWLISNMDTLNLQSQVRPRSKPAPTSPGLDDEIPF